MGTAINVNIPDAPSITLGKPARGLGLSLWIAQILLALVFGFAGAMKLFTPIEDLAKNAAWIKDSAGLIRFIGTSELAGALGMLLPSLTRIKPKLTSLAAVGLFIIMVLATGFHLLQGEAKVIPMTLLLGALAAFVAWGRGRKVVIAARAASTNTERRGS
jgi:putative oxidoreductase